MRVVVYPVLASPNLIYGIPRRDYLLGMFVAAPFWTLMQNIFFAFLVYLLLLAAAWVMAKIDPDFTEIVWTKGQRLGRTDGPGTYKGNRYVA